MNETFIPACNYEKKKWYIIDCKGKQLGRISSAVVSILTGKFKLYYYPSLDVGDYIILINAENINFNSNIEKFHVFKPGRPGRSLKRLLNLQPSKVLENCIFGMMPNGIAKYNISKRLKIYQKNIHPHSGQMPIQIML